MAVAAKIREETGADVETLWGDDGFVVRFPDVDQPPDPRLLLPDPDEVQALVVRQLGATALFASKFRENAARSLLLPKRRPGMRAPLWQQRKRAADLLAVASRYGSFPVLLETYRECLRDFFDMPALVSTLADVRSRKIRVATVDSETPSPFAASLLFSYVASFIYDGDAPLAERRAQALAVDQAQLRELLGDAELRELLDADSMDAIERQLQRLDPSYHVEERRRRARHAAVARRPHRGRDPRALADRRRRRERRARWSPRARVLPIRVAGEPRLIAVEDAARFRDALGVPLPAGIPESLLAAGARSARATWRCATRARTRRSPRPTSRARYALGDGGRRSRADASRGRRPPRRRRVPPGRHAARVDRRRRAAHAAAPLARQAAPRGRTGRPGRCSDDSPRRGRAIVKRRRGADALLDAIEQLQGAPLPASILETEILPARIDIYDPADLDAVTAAGEVVWVGVEPLGERDGRVALYLADHLPRLLRRGPPKPDATGHC